MTRPASTLDDIALLSGLAADARDVYFIASGSVRVVNWSYSGREVSFEDVPAGGHHVRRAGSHRRRAPLRNVVALEATEVGSVNPDVFMSVILGNPATARRLLERLTAIVRRSTERIFDLSVNGANIRIYADLLRLADANVRDDNSAEITPIPVHSDTAARVSTTRETVARVMGDLSRRDLVTRAKDRLIVTDIDRLAELIEE
jgi:CRP/FNR family cyclic AMP-dependent transcriptional regulator